MRYKSKLILRSVAVLLSALMIIGIVSIAGTGSGLMADPVYATKTTLSSGPFNKHTPVTYEYDLAASYPLPKHNYADYLQSRGILFPGDKVKILPQEKESTGHGGHGIAGKAIYDNNEYKDLTPGTVWDGCIKITKTEVLGGTQARNFIREIEIVGSNPVMLQGYKASFSGWAYTKDPDNPSATLDYWGVTSLTYIILPRYQKVVYQYRDNGQVIDKPAGAEFYDDNNPEVIWAEDLSVTWPETDGTQFILSRPYIEGYSFNHYYEIGSGGNDCLVTIYGGYNQMADDNDHFEVRFFNRFQNDYGFSFDNKKHGDEENDFILIKTDYRSGENNGWDFGTVKLDANGGTIRGRDSFIYSYNDYYNLYVLDLEKEIPVKKYATFLGWYSDPDKTELVCEAGLDEYEFYNKINKYYKNNCGDKCCITLYAGWEDKAPTATPTVKPSATPTAKPVSKPTAKPTAKPTSKPATATPTPVIKLSLNKSSANIVCGKTLTLKATLTGTSSAVTWKSSNTAIATVDKTGKITAKQAGPVTITASAAGKSASCKIQVLFKDVTDSKDFWYEPTYYLVGKDVVKGYDNQTLFKPGNECTRAQMLTFMYRLNGNPKTKTATCKFPDVKSDDYFYKAVIWAVEKGITTGYSDGTFKPQNVCTRAQTVTFLWRMAGKPAPKTKTNVFKDVKTDAYYYKATLWASEKKILAGYSDGTFKPDGKCLRRQMVTFLYKYDKFVNGKG